jgi:hypothetical protein
MMSQTAKLFAEKDPSRATCCCAALQSSVGIRPDGASATLAYQTTEVIVKPLSDWNAGNAPRVYGPRRPSIAPA